MGSKRLSFTVTGAFVTRTAREWFWDEHKPWEKIEEFLWPACVEQIRAGKSLSRSPGM